jgi:hypothetical protein
MLQQKIGREKTRVIKRINELVAPRMWESGYRTGPLGQSRPLKLWVPQDAEGDSTGQTFKLRGGFVLESFEGFTEEGVITDSYGGGLATADYRTLPLEDLYKLERFVARRFANVQE